ncbi:MAG TPA: hypothetical protein EYP22_07880 [Methanosarcinales archaeon]|nr:hypothetical protein [Methanosarcinales archaeon]
MKKEDEKMRFSIPNELYHDFKAIADMRGQTVSEVLQDIWDRFDPSLLVQTPESVRNSRSEPVRKV